MKKTLMLVAIIATLVVQGIAVAQPHQGRTGEMGRRPERIDKFRTMRLVEILKLNEEDAVRFFAKQSAHQEKIGGLMKERNAALDDAEASAKQNSGEAELQKGIDKVLDLDQQIFAERQRYQKEMRAFLTPAQFLTFISFERQFGMQVRDALGKMRRQGPSGRDRR
jgi:hypothetical protein